MTFVKKTLVRRASRHVVSATKAQLDRVAGGEISRGAEPSKQSQGGWKDLIDPQTGGILYDGRDSEPAPKAPGNR